MKFLEFILKNLKSPLYHNFTTMLSLSIDPLFEYMLDFDRMLNLKNSHFQLNLINNNNLREDKYLNSLFDSISQNLQETQYY
jgi:hypothetical protein